jgi:3-isopropylmalate/(R)-2-methylmalate dehydratase small subunit
MAIEKIVRVSGRGLPLRGNDIDTDRIIPARFLKSVSFEGLEHHLFEDDIAQTRSQGVVHPLTDPRYAGASVLVVSRNFGCGSSREHAPQAIRRKGFAAVVGESFSEIFFGNSVALGMPCVTAAQAEVDRLQNLIEEHPATEVMIDLDALRLSCDGLAFPVVMPTAARESFLDGSWDATALLLDRYEAVEERMRQIPYIGGWTA